MIDQASNLSFRITWKSQVVIISIVILYVLKVFSYANPIPGIGGDEIQVSFNKTCYEQNDFVNITLQFLHNNNLQDPDEETFEVYIYRPGQSSTDYRGIFQKESEGVWKSANGAFLAGSPGNLVVVARAIFGGVWICRVEGFSIQEDCAQDCNSRIEIEWDSECHEYLDTANLTLRFYSDCDSPPLYGPLKYETELLVDPDGGIPQITTIFRLSNCQLASESPQWQRTEIGTYTAPIYINNPLVGQRILSVFAKVAGIYAQETNVLEIRENCSNICPFVIINEPSGDLLVERGQNVIISWDGTDPDDDSLVSLFYDTDSNYGNGGKTAIASAQPEDGSCVWSTEGSPFGCYYILAEISDQHCSHYDYSSGRICITCSEPLPPSTISYPSTGCANTAFTVQWSQVADATSYTLQRATNPSFTGATNVYTGPSTSTTQTLGAGTYYYRVNASNECGSSGWRSGSEIVAKAIPATPFSISYPPTACANTAFTVHWSQVADATSYTLQRATNVDFSDSITVPTGNSLSVSQSLTAGTFYYRVNASNECGSSAWTNGVLIVIGPLPGPLSTISYSEASICEGDSLTIAWSPTPNTDKYFLERATNSRFSDSLTIYSGMSISHTHSVTIPGTYYYRVRATNKCGEVVLVGPRIIVNSCMKTLSISVDPLGTGDIYVNGQGPYENTNLKFQEGQTISLEANNHAGYDFFKWSGDVSSRVTNNPTMSVSMTANKRIKANFEEQKAVPVIKSVKVNNPFDPEFNSRSPTIRLDLEKGEYLLLEIEVENLGSAYSAGPFNCITVSFPDYKDSPVDMNRVVLNHLSPNMSFSRFLEAGYDYLLVEANTNEGVHWTSREPRVLSLKIFPKMEGDLLFYYRAGMSTKETWDDKWWAYDPDLSRTKDCLGKPVNKMTLNVVRRSAPENVWFASATLRAKHDYLSLCVPSPYTTSNSNRRVPYAIAPGDEVLLDVDIESHEDYVVRNLQIGAKLYDPFNMGTELILSSKTFSIAPGRKLLIRVGNPYAPNGILVLQGPPSHVDGFSQFSRMNMELWLEWNNHKLTSLKFSPEDGLDYRYSNAFLSHIGWKCPYGENLFQPNTPYLFHTCYLPSGRDLLFKSYGLLPPFEHDLYTVDVCMVTILDSYLQVDKDLESIEGYEGIADLLEEINKFVKKVSRQDDYENARRIEAFFLRGWELCLQNSGAVGEMQKAFAAISKGINCLSTSVDSNVDKREIKEFENHIEEMNRLLLDANDPNNQNNNFYELKQELQEIIDARKKELLEEGIQSIVSIFKNVVHDVIVTACEILNVIISLPQNMDVLDTFNSNAIMGKTLTSSSQVKKSDDCEFSVTVRDPSGSVYETLEQANLGEVVSIPFPTSGKWTFEIATTCTREQPYLFQACSDAPDFAFSPLIFPHKHYIQSGETATFNVSLIAINEFDSTVELDVSVFPEPQRGHIVPTILPNPLKPTGASTLIVVTSSDVSPGVYSLRVKGTAGNIVHYVSALLFVGDDDSLPDDWEFDFFGDLNQSPDNDFDGDGLTNLTEYNLGTNPANVDTDFDLMPDGWEIQNGLDPKRYDSDEDPDGDGLTNIDEFMFGTHPLVFDADSDKDGTPDQFDLCPQDPGKVQPGVCGCGIADTDSDYDGIPDCRDMLPNIPIQKGDINNDGSLDLKDCILALQCCSGLPCGHISMEAEVNGDFTIGIEEAVYVLQNIAEVR